MGSCSSTSPWRRGLERQHHPHPKPLTASKRGGKGGDAAGQVNPHNPPPN